MLSGFSFQQELRQVRHGARESADRELLDRWLSDPRADEIWGAIREAAEHSGKAASPLEFIQTIIKARRSAQASVNRTYGTSWTKKFGRKVAVPGFNDEWATALPALKKKLAALSTKLGPLEVAGILEEEADFIRLLHRRYFGFADHLKLPDQPHPFPLSRKDQKGSRVRRLFAQIVCHHLQTHYGRWFEGPVATLTEIAFPGKEMDKDDVIKARRQRQPVTERRQPKGTFNRKIRD